jgi:crotonobetainyl-CoA:carnitine CoA-transferase CaiB-like acyl-CoA transferase
MLGDLCADVIKIESPGGDALRGLGVRSEGHSLPWAAVGRNKRSVALDLDTPRGRALLHRLVEGTDVLIENLPERTLERWGCRYADLAGLRPDLIVVSVTCFGRTGPYARRAGNGSLAEAFGGLTGMTGEADGPPLLTSLPVGDVLAAIAGTLGALAACYARDARGAGGQRVDVSMYEPVLQLLSNAVMQTVRTGEEPHRTGSRIPGAVPRNTYRTRDGHWIALSAVTDAMVGRLLSAMGQDVAAVAGRYGTSDLRKAHEDDLDADVARWVAGLDRDAVLAALLARRIPAGPVNGVADVLADPHVRERGSLVEVDDPALGALTLVGPIARLEGTPASIRSTGPALGAHTEQVLSAELGLDVDEIAQLRAAGVIGGPAARGTSSDGGA